MVGRRPGRPARRRRRSIHRRLYRRQRAKFGRRFFSFPLSSRTGGRTVT